MDTVTTDVRSRMMSSIRGKDTKPELIVRRHLHGSGFRYRLHRRDLPGNPDLVLPRWNASILVHGCFWHGHEGCRYFRIPKTRTDFWTAKIRGNAERDMRAKIALRRQGWRVFVVWECALRDEREAALSELVQHIQGSSLAAQIASQFSQRPTGARHPSTSAE